MKRRILLTATALTLACLGGQTITAQATTKNNCQVLPNGNKVIVSYGSNCDIGNIESIENIENIGNISNIENVQDILNQLQNCFPGISLPDCEFPGQNTPENTPGNTPESTPENKPESNPGSGGSAGSTPEDAPSVEDAPSEEESPSDEHAFVKQVVDLVNEERAKEGLSPLTIDTKVQAAALVRAKECEQLFSHTRPDGSSFTTALKEQNVSYRSAGENIAWGQRSPKEVMNAWMNSSGHRANIMNPDFTTIGVGYYENAAGTGYWCQLFTR